MIFILWIIIWLILNYIFWGFSFNTILCFVVGIFLIMPILLKINFKELKDIFKNKKLMWINILLNFIINPLLAFIISYLIFWIENYFYIFIFILLAIIPGWWLLMNWLHQTKSNLNVGFSLFAINLFIFSFVYIFYNIWTDIFINNYQHTQINQNVNIKNIDLTNYSLINYWNISTQTKNQQASCAIDQLSSKLKLGMPWCNFEKNNSTLIYGFYWFIVLIIIPFILSRIILFILKENYKKLIKYISYVSKFSSFIVIVYIFSLSYIREILNIEKIILIKSIISLIIFYLLLYFIVRFIIKISKFDDGISKSIFWNVFTRFTTLVLIFSILYIISWNESWIIIIPVIAYFIQILFASLFAIYYDKWKF